MECYDAIPQKLAELCCDLELICRNTTNGAKDVTGLQFFAERELLADAEELRAFHKKSGFPKIETCLLIKQSSKNSRLCWTNTESSLTESTTHMHPLDST